MYNVSSWTGLVFVSGKGNLIIHLKLELLFLLEVSSSPAVVDQRNHQPNATDPHILKREIISQPQKTPPSKTPPLSDICGHSDVSVSSALEIHNRCLSCKLPRSLAYHKDQPI